MNAPAAPVDHEANFKAAAENLVELGEALIRFHEARARRIKTLLHQVAIAGAIANPYDDEGARDLVEGIFGEKDDTDEN
jgi:hypothetical protein